MLGGPILPDDIVDASINLVRISVGWDLFLIVSPFLFLVVLFLSNYKLRIFRQISILLIVSGLCVIAFKESNSIFKYVKKNREYLTWDQSHNYNHLGPSFYLAQQTLRFLKSKQPQPSAVEVSQALLFLKKFYTEDRNAKESIKNIRNVHFVVMESLWDIGSMKNAGFSRDPFHDGFRDLWNRSGQSKALSPAFGGGTANAEFEALCGLQVEGGGIVFEKQTNRRLFCLPEFLSQNGYQTFASHPNIPAFWNRSNAYPRIGFKHFFSKDDFVPDDMNGVYLADFPLFKQAFERFQSYSKHQQPIFNYVLTLSMHLPFQLNSEKRPQIVTSVRPDSLAEKYANSVYYSTGEVIEYIDLIHGNDPNALIVIFGDHLPPLGSSYSESGLFEGNREKMEPSMLMAYRATPLLVLDGKDNPLNLGTISMYEIPTLVVSVLGLATELPQFNHRSFDGWRLRVNDGNVLIYNQSTIESNCRSKIQLKGELVDCRAFEKILRHMRVISDDMLYGKQYILKEN